MRHFESFSNNVFYWPIENHYLKMSSTVIKDKKSFFLTTIATEIHFCSISCISHTSQGIASPDQGVLIIVRILVTAATKAIIADFGVSPRFRKVRFPPCWCLNKKKVCWGFLKKRTKTVLYLSFTIKLPVNTEGRGWTINGRSSFRRWWDKERNNFVSSSSAHGGVSRIQIQITQI